MSFLLEGLFEKKVVDAYPLTNRALGLPVSKTGLTVDEVTALRVTALWACCNVICGDVGKVPLKLMQEKPDESKVVAIDHPLHRVLNRRPNEWQTSTEWRETMMLHALLAKGGYSYINRTESGEVLELIPLLPGRVCPKQDKSWQLTYELDTNGTKKTLRRVDVHAIHGLSWNGFSALELIKQGQEAIGLALATEESQARLHGQGVRPGGNVTTASKLSDPEVDRIKTEFAENYSGVQNSFKTILLDNGLKFEPWAMTGVDAQHLETRRHQVEEICRLLRVFPSMIGYSDKASTYASAEAFFIAHVVHTLMPWFNRWEQAMCRDLLSEVEIKNGYYAKFVVQGLLRGDSAARASFYESAVSKACWMTRNEARKLEDMNPLPGLDELLVPMNLQGGTQPKPGAPPAPPKG